MKAIILGAGYGTRLAKGLQELPESKKRSLEPAILGKPKPLVPIAGKPLLDYLVEKIERETSIQDVYVISNDVFFPQYEKWLQQQRYSVRVQILNDGTTSNETRLGVIGDLEFTTRTAKLDDDLLIIAGDTLFEINFGEFTRYFAQKKKDVIAIYEEDWDVLSRRGVVITNAQGKVLQFLEKPQHPPTNIAAPVLYVISRETAKRIPQAYDPNNKELNLIEWLTTREHDDIYTSKFPLRYDVGNINDYIHVNNVFTQRRP